MRPQQRANVDPKKKEFRDLLKASGWTQAYTAEQLGITESALSQIVRENSPTNPSGTTLRLFKLLLLREKPEALKAKDSPDVSEFLDDWERDAIAQMRLLTPEQRQLVLNLMASLLQQRNERAHPGTSYPPKKNRR